MMGIISWSSPARSIRRTMGALAALSAGLLLALMIDRNGALARATDPWLASWLAHGVGSVVAALLWSVSPRAGRGKTPPRWAWFGGLPGALTVVLASWCLNSPLGMGGTLALLLLGQLLFGAACDAVGAFGLKRRIPTLLDGVAMVLVISGALLIVLTPEA